MKASHLARLGCFLVLFAACGDDGNGGSPGGFAGNNGGGGDDGGGGSDGGGPVDQNDCVDACAGKLGDCGLDAASAASGCQKFCAQTDAAQLACFQKTSCAELQTNADVCPKGSSGKGGSSSGKGGTGGSGGSSSGKGGTGGSGGSSSGKGGTGGSSSGCDGKAPTCNGNQAVVCDDSSGFPVTTTTTCQDGCTNGLCNGRPKDLTISGTWSGTPKPVSVFDDKKGELSTLLTAEAKNTKASPTVSDPPNLNGLTATIVSPSLGNCNLVLKDKITMGSAFNVIVNLFGTDKGTSSDCATFLDKVASQGITATFTDVPYLNGGKADKVTIKITK